VTREAIAREGRKGQRSTEALLSIEQVAAELGIGRTYAYGLVASKQIPRVALGRLLRVRPSDLAAYVNGLVTHDSDTAA
jgi:excisionase family DNA binding protein